MRYRWEESTIKDYLPLKDIAGWSKCPKCNELPRVWIFDNGSFAKCRCTYKYDLPEASSESIMSVCRRNNGDVSEYDRDYLRQAWNRFVDTGEKQQYVYTN